MINRPIIIIGATRSGTTLLFRLLALHTGLWHLPSTESHKILEGPFHPKYTGYESNRVTKDDLDENTAQQLTKQFYDNSVNLNKLFNDPSKLMSANAFYEKLIQKGALKAASLTKLGKRHNIRFLEKTPKNSLRVSMLNELFPDAVFIWLIRDPIDNIKSIYTAWGSQEKVGFWGLRRYASAGYKIMDSVKLTDSATKKWRFLLPPNWRTLAHRTTMDAAVLQYYYSLYYANKDLAKVDKSKVLKIHFEDLTANPMTVVDNILSEAQLKHQDLIDSFAEHLPVVNQTKKTSALSNVESQIKQKIANYPDFAALMDEIYA